MHVRTCVRTFAHVCTQACNCLRAHVCMWRNPLLPDHTYHYLPVLSQCSRMGLKNVIDVKGEIDDRSAVQFAAELYAQLASLGPSAMEQAFEQAKRVLPPDIKFRYRCSPLPPGEIPASPAQMRLHDYEMNALSHYDFDAHNRDQSRENPKVHILRLYQRELLDVAKQHNSVVCLRNLTHFLLPAVTYRPSRSNLPESSIHHTTLALP